NLRTLFPSSGSQAFAYDTENRLISAAVNGSSTPSNFYDYDAFERRVTKTVGGSALGSGGTPPIICRMEGRDCRARRIRQSAAALHFGTQDRRAGRGRRGQQNDEPDQDLLPCEP